MGGALNSARFSVTVSPVFRTLLIEGHQQAGETLVRRENLIIAAIAHFFSYAPPFLASKRRKSALSVVDPWLPHGHTVVTL
jgi:hypothetical protein